MGVDLKEKKKRRKEAAEEDQEESEPKKQKCKGGQPGIEVQTYVDPELGQQVVKTNEQSVANRELPPIPIESVTPDENGNCPYSLLLFYQYIEPPWTTKQHSKALSYVTNMGNKIGIGGRGRCAREGLNCTITGTAQQVRDFCLSLRKWDKTFENTDFKITDGIPYEKRFRAFTLLKKDELVAYGLPSEIAPRLHSSEAKHLEATEYHELMKDPEAVIIDVRNFYENNIGHFNPPPGGAELIDPMMRNSHEFPKWLNSKETQDKLNGKKVMMYCTGGIRCERAAALLDQIAATTPGFSTQGIHQVRGGIERYLKTFPEGGFWKGKNYLFDRRIEQKPELKSDKALEKDIESYCCNCKKPWAHYTGQKKCAGMTGTGENEKECGVPVLVCKSCQNTCDITTLRCPLCERSIHLKDLPTPNLKADRQKLSELRGIVDKEAEVSDVPPHLNKRANKGKASKDAAPDKRLFLGNLPYTIDLDQVQKVIKDVDPEGKVAIVDWLYDKQSGLFYGSAFVKVNSVAVAEKAVAAAAAVKPNGSGGIRVNKRLLRITFAPPKEGIEWPAADFKQLHRPRIGLV